MKDGCAVTPVHMELQIRYFLTVIKREPKR
jgi:hypothetical protein